jgi:hypothetical protein
MAMVRHNVDGGNDISMLEGGADAKLGGDLFLVLLLALAGAFGAELLYSKGRATGLCAAFYEANSAAGTAAKHTAPLAILFSEMSVGRVLERGKVRRS